MSISSAPGPPLPPLVSRDRGAPIPPLVRRARGSPVSRWYSPQRFASEILIDNAAFEKKVLDVLEAREAAALGFDHSQRRDRGSRPRRAMSISSAPDSPVPPLVSRARGSPVPPSLRANSIANSNRWYSPQRVASEIFILMR